MTRISFRRIRGTASLGAPNGRLTANIPALGRAGGIPLLLSNDSYIKRKVSAEGEIPSRVYAEIIPVLKVRGIA
jgi:hypothetical protein